MNLLYLAHRIPYPPNKGEKIRIFHQIRHLARQHRIHLCTFVDDPNDMTLEAELSKYCTSVALVYRGPVGSFLRVGEAFIGGLPLSVSLFKNRKFAKSVLLVARDVRLDCLMVSSSSVAQYASLVPSIPKLIDFIDIDSEKWRLYAERTGAPLSLVYEREQRLLAKYEEKITRVFDHSIVVSEEEKHALQNRVGNHRVSAICNGVDSDYFFPDEASPGQSSLPIIVFTGVMDYFPNVDAVEYFCKEIFPSICASVPQVQFQIVGRNPTRRVKMLANQSNVVVTGTVADVRPYLREATVAVAPFRFARGVQNKVLEAMAMGLPVVGSSETFKAIAASSQDGVRIADDPVSFAKQVIALLQVDSDARRRLAKETRSYVERHHRWKDQGEKLENILIDIVERGGELASEVKNAALA